MDIYKTQAINYLFRSLKSVRVRYPVADIGRTELIKDMGGQLQKNTSMAPSQLMASRGRNKFSGQEEDKARYNAHRNDTH